LPLLFPLFWLLPLPPLCIGGSSGGAGAGFGTGAGAGAGWGAGAGAGPGAGAGAGTGGGGGALAGGAAGAGAEAGVAVGARAAGPGAGSGTPAGVPAAGDAGDWSSVRTTISAVLGAAAPRGTGVADALSASRTVSALGVSPTKILSGVMSQCGRRFGVHVDDRAGQDERWLRFRRVLGERRVQRFE
jgi:hypothetical protein